MSGPPPANSSPPPTAAPPPSNPTPPPATPPTSPPAIAPSPKSPPPLTPADPPSDAPPPESSPPPKVTPPDASPPPPNASPPPADASPPPPGSSPPPPDAFPPPPDSPPASPPLPVAPTPSSPPGRPASPPPPIFPPPRSQSLAPAPTPSKDAKTNIDLVVGTTVGAVVGVTALLLVCFVLWKKRPRRRDTNTNFNDLYPGHIQSSLINSQPQPSTPSYQMNDNFKGTGTGAGNGKGGGGPAYLSLSPITPAVRFGGPYKYEELSVATNGFSETNVLGQGGFGLVYKGTLNEKEVAIKKLKTGGSQGEREFRAEVETISRVHHRNLVCLVGYCIREDQRLLVYEYVPNKTLNFHLHGSGRPTLDWLRRWKIALGSAKGLAYLHEDCDPKIIHRDIKADNILLDYNFEPKVADFGLAKLVPDNISHVSTRVMGTFGYVAPEYMQSGHLTDRSDVYSYGVVILELITGRKPLSPAGSPYSTLVEWARQFLSRSASEDVFDELVDPRLERNYDQHDMARLIHCASAAVRKQSRKRPRMSQIVRFLEGEISLDDLNAGVNPGESGARGAGTSEVNTLRRMAFGGVISEDLESLQSDQSSNVDGAEFKMKPSNQR